jgi:hypothetical protein
VSEEGLRRAVVNVLLIAATAAGAVLVIAGLLWTLNQVFLWIGGR